MGRLIQTPGLVPFGACICSTRVDLYHICRDFPPILLTLTPIGISFTTFNK